MAGTPEHSISEIVIAPALDVSFADAVKRTNELHTGAARASDFRHHRADGSGIEHTHEIRLDDIIKMVAQGNLVAAEFFGVGVEIAAAHSRAEIAGILVDAGYDIEDLCLKNGQRNA